MKNRSQGNVRQLSPLVAAALVALIGMTVDASAQPLKNVKTADTPLVLKAQGRFFVGGETVEQTQVELGELGPGGHITVNQMYVRYMVLADWKRRTRGDGARCHLDGQVVETTPDGRMGWDEYFVRKGHSVYVSDQVGRGRSGFNQAVFKDVRAGDGTRQPPSLAGSGSATRSSGRTSASGPRQTRPMRIVSSR